MVEYETRKEAETAIREGSGSKLLDAKLECDFAFVRYVKPKKPFCLSFQTIKPTPQISINLHPSAYLSILIDASEIGLDDDNTCVFCFF